MKNLQHLEKIEEVDKKVSIAKNIVILSFFAIVLLSALGIGGYAAYVRYKKYIDPDKKTHIYAPGQKFAYSGYDFDIRFNVTDISYSPYDCNDSAIYAPFPGTKLVQFRNLDQCNSANQARLYTSNEDQALNLNVSVFNPSSNESRPLNIGWFKIFDGQGSQIDLSSYTSKQFPTNDLLPGEVREGKINGLMVRKNSGKVRIAVEVAGKSPQYVASDK